MSSENVDFSRLGGPRHAIIPMLPLRHMQWMAGTKATAHNGKNPGALFRWIPHLAT